MTPKEALQKALEILGPNGENWGQVAMPRTKNCAGTAVVNAVGIEDSLVPTEEKRELMIAALKGLDKGLLIKHPELTGEEGVMIINFNDDPTTTFPMIKEVFEAAIAAA